MVNRKTKKDIERDVRRSERKRVKSAEAKDRLSALNAETGNYMHSLLSPATHRGARIPDSDTRHSFTMHSRSISNLSPLCTSVSDISTLGAATNGGIGTALLLGVTPAHSYLTPSWAQAGYVLGGGTGAPPGPFSPIWSRFPVAAATPVGTINSSDFAPVGAAMVGIGGGLSGASWMNANVFNQLQTTAVAIRPVSAQVTVEYIGPALTAQGNYVVGFVDAFQEIDHKTKVTSTGSGVTTKLSVESGVQEFFNSFNGASQLPNVNAYPAMTKSVTTWRPQDVANQRYYELDLRFTGSSSGSPLAPYAFADTGDDSAKLWTAGPTDLTLNMQSFGLETGLIPSGFFYIYAQGLDPNLVPGTIGASSPCFQVTMDVNYECIPRNNQMMIGGVDSTLASRYDHTALEMAANHGQLVPTTMAASTESGDELPDDHPTVAVKSAAQKVVQEIAHTKGTPKESATTSGHSFLEKVAQFARKAAPYAEAAAEYVPEVAALL